MDERIYMGISLSAGVCLASVHTLSSVADQNHAEDESERDRLDKALVRCQLRLEAIQSTVRETLGERDATLFDPQIRLLTDARFRGAIAARMDGGRTALAATEEEIEALQRSHSPGLRIADLMDLGNRLTECLLDSKTFSPSALRQPFILVAEEIHPAHVVQLEDSGLAGLALERGSRNGHAAILARTLGVPAVSGVAGLLQHVAPGALMLLDGTEGRAILHPSPVRLKRLAASPPTPHADPHPTAFASRDGFEVTVRANVGTPHQIDLALAAGAEGIGLFRTEMLALKDGRPPSFKRQVEVYQKALAGFRPHPVTFRLMDLTRDKSHAATPSTCREQLRAIMTASPGASSGILVPHVSRVEHVEGVADLLSGLEAETELSAPPLGAMLENAAACLMVADLSRLCRFFSLGTNDLASSVLGRDRASLRHEDTFHPAVLRLVRQVAMECARLNIPLSVCGEMAADPLALPFLIGLGISILSVSPPAIAGIRRLLGSIDRQHTADLAENVCSVDRASRAEEMLRDYIERIEGGIRRAEE